MATLHWSPASHAQPLAGVALVIHGLNYRPDRMQPLVDCLNAAGVECLSLSLHGHGDNYLSLPGLDASAARLESFRRVTYTLWRDETLAAYTIIRTRAETLGLPLLLASFSHGALMGCVLSASRPDVRFDRMVLFAPALALRMVGRLPRLLRRWPRAVIPSLAPRQYRANRGAPSAAYTAVYAALAAFRSNDLQRLNSPALLLIDRGDELVSYPSLERLTVLLPAWILSPVRKSDRAGSEYHHLVIGEPAVGAAAWQDITERITAFVRGETAATAAKSW